MLTWQNLNHLSSDYHSIYKILNANYIIYNYNETTPSITTPLPDIIEVGEPLLVQERGSDQVAEMFGGGLKDTSIHVHIVESSL